MEYINSPVGAISRVGLGTWAMGGWGEVITSEADEMAVETIKKAVEMDVTLIDTAPAYGEGHSEKLVGRALKESGYRNKVILATKCGLSWDDKGTVYRDSRPETLKKEVEASLERLQTNYIDIYQVHWPDADVPIAETAQCLKEILDSGKIRTIGLSNYTNAMIDEWRKYAPVHFIQPSYNILEDKLFENQIPYAQEHGISILGYSSLCRGMLHGTYTKDTKFNDGDMRGEKDPKYLGENFLNHLAAVDELKEYAKTLGKKVDEIAMRWVLDKGVSCALYGCRKPHHLGPIAGCTDFKLSPEQCDYMSYLVAKHVPVQVGKEYLAPPLMSEL